MSSPEGNGALWTLLFPSGARWGWAAAALPAPLPPAAFSAVACACCFRSLTLPPSDFMCFLVRLLFQVTFQFGIIANSVLRGHSPQGWAALQCWSLSSGLPWQRKRCLCSSLSALWPGVSCGKQEPVAVVGAASLRVGVGGSRPQICWDSSARVAGARLNSWSRAPRPPLRLLAPGEM